MFLFEHQFQHYVWRLNPNFGYAENSPRLTIKLSQFDTKKYHVLGWILQSDYFSHCIQWTITIFHPRTWIPNAIDLPISPFHHHHHNHHHHIYIYLHIIRERERALNLFGYIWFISQCSIMYITLYMVLILGWIPIKSSWNPVKSPWNPIKSPWTPIKSPWKPVKNHHKNLSVVTGPRHSAAELATHSAGSWDPSGSVGGSDGKW